MPVFGPSQISADAHDGEEAGDTTWYLVGQGAYGAVVGDVAGTSSDMGMLWDNVTIPKGVTILTASVELFVKALAGTGDIVTRMQGFDVDDMSPFGASNRPSQIAQTTALVDRTYVYTTDLVDETTLVLDDCAAIVQEIVDRASWASGNALGLVLKDNGSASGERVQFHDYSFGAGNAAKITITYTVAATVDLQLPALDLQIYAGSIGGGSGSTPAEAIIVPTGSVQNLALGISL